MQDSRVHEARASIEAVIAGRTVCGQLDEVARAHPDAPAYSDPAGEDWSTLTFGQARSRVLEIAAGLAALGAGPGDTVALMMANRSEHILADLGAVHAGAVPCSIYPTFAPEQIAFIAADVGARIAVLDGPAELARWEPVLDHLPRLEKIIMLEGAPSGDRFSAWADLLALGAAELARDPAAVEARWRAVTPGDTLTVLYTSGTTGSPKGVPITHANVLYEVEATTRLITIPEHGVQISYLPYAHIAERVFSLYLPLFKVNHVCFCPDPALLGAVLPRVRPTLFLGVPRVWEKLAAGLSAHLAALPEERRSGLRRAMAAGLAQAEAGQYGRTPSEEVRAAYEAADAAVLSGVRRMIGFDRAIWTASGAAPLPGEVQRFFAGLGVKILELYGMTETTGAVTANSAECYRLGTVGRAGPGVEIRIAADGEVLTRSPVNTHGYLGRSRTADELLDADGWLHTGDVGSLDEDGFLRVVDRKKELIITSGGENVSPAGIESLLNEHPLVGQALAYGDRRPYCVAMLTLDPDIAPAWAAARGIAVTGLAELAAHPDVRKEVEAAVAAANARLARVQQIKRWRLLPVAWTPQTGELTPSLKLRRRVIHTRYADVIESLYAT